MHAIIQNTIKIELQATIHRQPSTLFCAFDSRYELEMFAPASGEKHTTTTKQNQNELRCMLKILTCERKMRER